MIELLLQAERAMSVGLVDRADTLYAQVAEADPQNSIAVVGLARVALERGDAAGALALARRALAIDPENAAAARMVQRLDEVLRYRTGEGVTTTLEAMPGPEPVPTPAPGRPPEPPEPPQPEPPTPTPTPTPTPKRRSLLDRLLRRNR